MKKMLHENNLNLELTEEYKDMIDTMLEQEDNGTVEYVSYKRIKDRFQNK
ncbi:MAG: hypothetical protein JWQ63_2708 [Mucilaginibacter sp.]|jgi:hypothetical protein|nr:hypothetical protein [Mucilaginibacter sp.]